MGYICSPTYIFVSVEDDDDEDEPLMSGKGEVCREITDDQLLQSWAQVIRDWHDRLRQTTAPTDNAGPDPDRLLTGTTGPMFAPSVGSALLQRIKLLVYRGIPDTLRTEVWRLMAVSLDTEAELMEAYRILNTKVSELESSSYKTVAVKL